MTDLLRHLARPRAVLLQLAAVTLSWSFAANASEIYKWVDDDGVVHFSDMKPKTDVSVTTLEFRALNSAHYDPQADPYSILNQAERSNESWTVRMTARQPAATEPDSARVEYVYPPYPSPLYYPVTGYYPVVPPPGTWRRYPAAARQQQNALETLDLAGLGPQSVNSGTHHQRVLRSEALPLVTPNAGPGSIVTP